MEELLEKVSETETLPTISSVAKQLLSLSLDTEKGERELLSLIESDPFISARIIGMANSPIFAPTKKVCTLKDAAMIIGLSKVKMIATAIALMNPLKVRQSSIFSLKDLWLHSFSIAIGMRTLASMLPRQKRPAEDMLFLSGLLHDLGYLALAYVAPKKFDAFISRLESNPEEIQSDAELQEFGVTHEGIGAALGRNWNLPEEVISVIEGHHDESRTEVPLVLLGLIESITGEGAIRKKVSREISQKELDAIGLTRENLDSMKDVLLMQQEQIAFLAETLAG